MSFKVDSCGTFLNHKSIETFLVSIVYLSSRTGTGEESQDGGQYIPLSSTNISGDRALNVGVSAKTIDINVTRLRISIQTLINF